MADYVVIHQRDTQLMSISDLSEACGVAEATVSRFCRRLNYKGYSAFKLAIAHSIARTGQHPRQEGYISPEDNIPTLCQKLYEQDSDALAQAQALIRPEAVTAAADLLLSARRVLCMVQGGSMVMAMEAAHLFSTALPSFTAVWDSHLQIIAAANLTPEDAVLFFSYSGSTRESLDLLAAVRERKAKAILVTHFPKSPAAALADIILQCGASELPLQHGSVPARIAQLFILDVLFAEVLRKGGDACRENQERIAAALSGKHL